MILRKMVTGIAISVNITLIGLFKYADFTIKNINTLFSTDIPLLKLALPIGISFYTFQAISYIIDVYRREVKAQKNIINLSLYISLFPQLIAGPIVRYQTVNNELAERTHSFADFSYGVRRFIFGLSKKLLIADQIANLWTLATQTNQPSVLYYWLGAIAFSLQIYFDFSGYSDMAIGMGRMFGFHFLENFDHPFCSKSITEFWRRWHISLGSWFRDYLYIPLGGNRQGKLRWIFNLFVVWGLTGFWHGADWNFVLWGLLFGIALMFEKLFMLKVLEKIPSFFSHIYTILIVVLSFVLFNNSIADAATFIKSMIGLTNIPLISAESLYYLHSYFGVLVISIVFSTDIPSAIFRKITINQTFKKIADYIEPVLLIILLLLSVGYLVDSSFQPFLYFRF
ncbi:MBOAT family O-acyltransferase [Sedimentibacter sp. LTW-03]|uniref:MBOAT family O-acyltransferase n=1 Tax=Sedimentibacter sp. LTW-03 TaxID=3453406 RepID=UPI003F874111